MTREEAIYRLKNMAWLYGSAEREQNIEAIDMAIEALSAEPKIKVCEERQNGECPFYTPDWRDDDVSEPSDLISRADAIEAVAQQWLFEASAESPYVNDDDIGEYKKLAEELFEDVPSAEAVQGEWIPCSERLPKRDELVLVTYKTTDRIHLCRYLDDGSENPWWSYIDDCCAWNNVVLAWMPLPKPYREDDNE